MKLKFTAFILASLLCMAGAVSCGTHEIETESSIELNVVTDAEDGTVTTAGATVTTSAGGTTSTTAAGETTTGASAGTPTGETTAAPAAAETPAATEAPAPTEAPAQQQEQPQQNNETPADNQNNEQPQTQEVKFSLDELLKNSADTIAALGGSPVTATSPSCTSNGCDVKTYDYAGELKIQCYIDGGVEYIFDYDILGGNYSTSKGIKVGSSRADVEAAYGTGEESGNMLIYTDGSKQLIFTMNGDTVSEIDFYVPV